jgi:hypothetical protein
LRTLNCLTLSVSVPMGASAWTLTCRVRAKLLTGGGVKKGCVYGSTDKQAAYPKDHPVSPGDVVAAIYECLGIDPHMTVPD